MSTDYHDTSPARDGIPVTPSDSADLADDARSLYVGGSGDIKVTSISGHVATYAAVPVGIFPIKVRRVWSTGTTATDIVALY